MIETGLALIQQQQFEEAIKHFEKILQVEAKNEYAHNYLGMTYAFLGEMETAIGCIRTAVSLNTEYAEAYSNLGVLLGMQGQLEEAIQCYRQALAINNQLPEIYNNLGLLLKQKEEWPEALEAFEKAVALYPDYGDALNNLGIILANLDRGQEAISYLQRAIALQPDNIEAILFLGRVFRDLKDLDQAIPLFEKIAAEQPDRADVHNYLGLAYRDNKQLDKAEEQFRQAIICDPTYAEAYRNLGVTLYRQGTLKGDKALIDTAIGYFKQALVQDPTMAEGHNNLGVVYRDQGEFDLAKECFLKAIELRPRYGVAHRNLAQIYVIEVEDEPAIYHYSVAIECNPKDVDAYRPLCLLFSKQGKYQEALAITNKLLTIDDDDFTVLTTKGKLLFSLQMPEEALVPLQRAKELAPDNSDMILTLGRVLAETGRLAEARQEWQGISAKEPMAQLFNALSLPWVYQSLEEMERERQHFSQDLHRLLNRNLKLDNPFEQVGSCPFLLAYQGYNDRPIMEELGQMWQAACPQLAWTAPHCQSRFTPARPKIRLGICSALLISHTIGKLYGTIVQYLNRDKFEVILLSVKSDYPDGELGERIKDSAARVIELANDFFRARQQIADLELDILFYPDIGMSPFTYFMTFARLAPVQCLTWGHPSTTGSSVMDYFISSELFEVASAQDHYTEKLIRFRQPNTCFVRPEKPAPTDRVALGLPATGNLYLCPQSLFKLHPEFDQILGGILRGDPTGQVVLISMGKSPQWTTSIKERWQETLPDVFERLFFIDKPLPLEQFLQLLTLGDVMLDPIHFGGGNSSLEAFAMGIPIVTYPGQYLKSRLTYGFYRQMELMDCVAHSHEEYIEIALRLGTDPSWNQQVRAEIEARSPQLYENRAVIEEYERFFTTAITLSRAGKTA